MNQSEIQEHTALKAKFPDYPRIPKSALSSSSEPGHVASCVRGFYKRLGNWVNMKAIQDSNKLV